MSPQFVDLNADGKLDMLAGTFAGSPQVAFGADKSWKQPEQILDRNGLRIVANKFWNFDTERWESTTRCDAVGMKSAGAHLTSAVAFDWEGDGDLDLLLGDHKQGHVFLRRNEGSATRQAFAARNEVVSAAGKPLIVPGTVATLRLIDWNRDGLVDLACGSMGDPYKMEEGGGIFLYLNAGTKQAPLFGEPLVLLPPSSKTSTSGPTRPDSGLYMDFGDVDGDGDIDMVAGGYSHWTPRAPELTDKQKIRVAELEAQLAKVNQQDKQLRKALEDVVKGLDDKAAAAKREELQTEQLEARRALNKQLAVLKEEIGPMVPGNKRNSYVWLYENLSATAPSKSSETR